MVGSARRKSRLPRKILRIKLDDGSCQLQVSAEFKIKAEPGDHYTNGNDNYSPPQHYRDYAFDSPRYDNDFHNNFDKSPMNTTSYDRYYKNREMTPSPIHYMSENQPPKFHDSTPRAPRVKSTKLVGNKHQHPEPNAEFPYQCETCDMLFKSIDHLSEHQKSVHDNNRQFTCRFCSKKFNDKYNMRKHVLIHVGERRHKCQYCDKAFLRKDHLRSHLQTHYNRKYGCKSCGKGFRSIEMFERHAKTHKVEPMMEIFNENGPSPPSISMVDNDKKPDLKDIRQHNSNEVQQFHQAIGNHEIEMDSIQPVEHNSIQSSELHGIQSSEHNSIQPTELHSIQPSELHSIQSSGYNSNDTHNIQSPVKLETMNNGDSQHNNDSRSSDDQFTQNNQPTDDDVRTTMTDDVPVTILDDQMEEGFEWNLDASSPHRSDYSMNTGESPLSMYDEEGHLKPKKYANQHTSGYKCKACNQTFDDKFKFDAHQNECAKEKWQCRKCNIVFDEVATLKQHYQQVHSVEKPQQRRSCWTCKTCVITFPNSKELSRHYAQYHKDAQMYPCSECPKTFTVWHNLKKHMLIHLGDKKHKCNICDKGFVRKDHLNSHMKVHLGDGTKYNCPICGKVFRIKDMYFKHMNLHGLEKAYTVSQ